jgi:hypothetical protein
MPEPTAIWNFAKSFVLEFLGEAKRVLLPTYNIEIVDQDGASLVLRSMGREVVVNKRHQTVKSEDKVLARFDAIQAIEIARERSDDSPDTWKVSLYISWFSRVQIGRTSEATEASIVGARLSTITGKKVVAHP